MTHQVEDRGAAPSLLLPIGEAAAMMGMSEKTFMRRVEDKTFPAPVRFGRLVRWPKAELLAVIETAKAQRIAA